MTPDQIATRVIKYMKEDEGYIPYLSCIIYQSISDEREACAKVAESRPTGSSDDGLVVQKDIVWSIRQRGEGIEMKDPLENISHDFKNDMGLTPQERANKIYLDLSDRSGFPDWEKDIRKEIISDIAAQIKEAERKARWAGHEEAQLTGRKEAYTEGFSTARDMAKGIAEEVLQENIGQVMACRKIANRISKMEPDK